LLLERRLLDPLERPPLELRLVLGFRVLLLLDALEPRPLELRLVLCFRVLLRSAIG
jgi:hypothetical protein